MIDHREESFGAAVDFWAGARGATRPANPDRPWTDREDFETHATIWP